MSLLLLYILISIVVRYGNSTLGIDIAGSYTQSQFQCFVQNGIEFVITRAWHSYGAFDTAAPNTIKNSHASGIKYNDVYLFPCTGMSATQQVNEMISNLTYYGVAYGDIWLDLEQNPKASCDWAQFNATYNCNFIAELGNAIKAKGKTPGIYSTHWEWCNIIFPGQCDACKSVSDIQLWYADWDGATNFNDYSNLPFGGWTSPTIKQYDDKCSYCANVDRDWYP
eukprot:41489_1